MLLSEGYDLKAQGSVRTWFTNIAAFWRPGVLVLIPPIRMRISSFGASSNRTVATLALHTQPYSDINSSRGIDS